MDIMIFNKKIVWYVLGPVVILAGFLTIRWFYFLLTYGEHEGFTEGVFGYPIPFNYALFYLLYWFAALIGAIFLLGFKKIGWYVLNIVAVSGFIYLMLAVSLSLYSGSSIKYAVYLLQIVACLLFICFLNNKKLIHHFMVKEKVANYVIVSFGVAALGTVAAFLFGFLSTT